jgi:hypothetical protein
MKKIPINEIRKWLIALGFIILLIFIVFFRESIKYKILASISVVYLFVLPGIPLAYWLINEDDFLKRFILSFVFGVGLMTIMSYHLSLIGLNANYYHIYLPILVFAGGLVVLKFKR